MIIFQDVDESADISPSSSVLSLRQEEVIFLHTFFHISPSNCRKMALVQCSHQFRELKENQGILFSNREISGRERFSEISGKMREVSCFLLFRFRAVAFSILNHTSSLVLYIILNGQK